jgi:hypothetical protein
MRKLLLTLVLAGCGNQDKCSTATGCPTARNYYQLCSGGTSDDCYYQTSDNRRFHCVHCGDCDEARSSVTTWCATPPANNNNTSTGSHSGYTCSSSVSCPGGAKSYTACASPTGGQCTYKTSDGTYFDCGGCSDCNGAVQRVIDWCNGASSGGSTTSSGGSTTGGTVSDSSCFSQASTACQTCCAGHHGDGANYYADAYITCGCGFCSSACNAAGDVCHGGSTQSSACADCFNNNVPQNCGQQIQSSCAANSACSAFLTCVAGC